MKGISIQGIVVGIIADMLAIIAIDEFVAIYAAVGRELPVKELCTNTENLLWCFFGDAIPTVIGGYVTGKIAKDRPYANALALSIISLVIAIIIYFTTEIYSKPHSLWPILAGYIVYLPAVFLGAYLSKLKLT